MFEEVEVNSERWFELKNLKNEIWKDLKVIKNNKIYYFKKLYKVSNYGRIKSLGIYHGKTNNFFNKPHILKGRINKGGYVLYSLCNYGNLENFTAHRIVATTFILNPNNYPEVNHKDGNKLNNKENNLEWCTISYNIKHAYDNGLKFAKGYSLPKEKNPNAKYTEKQIEEIRKKRENGYKLRELAKEYETYESYICCICKRKFWK